MIITTTTTLSWNLKGRRILSSTRALLSVDNPHAPAFTCYFSRDCSSLSELVFCLRIGGRRLWRRWRSRRRRRRRKERWCRPERLERLFGAGSMRLCMEVRQWQQLFGLYTTSRIRYRPLSPGASSLSVSFPDAASHPFFWRR